MNKAAGKVCMAKLARVKLQQAELFAEEAKLLRELAEGESVDIRTGRLRPSYTSTRPRIEQFSEAEIANARAALRASDIKQRNAAK
jgi:hypothetical protein